MAAKAARRSVREKSSKSCAWPWGELERSRAGPAHARGRSARGGRLCARPTANCHDRLKPGLRNLTLRSAAWTWTADDTMMNARHEFAAACAMAARVRWLVADDDKGGRIDERGFCPTGCTKREGVQRHPLVGDRHSPGRPTSMKALRAFEILCRNAAPSDSTSWRSAYPPQAEGELRAGRQHWVGDRGLTGGGMRSEC